MFTHRDIRAGIDGMPELDIAHQRRQRSDRVHLKAIAEPLIEVINRHLFGQRAACFQRPHRSGQFGIPRRGNYPGHGAQMFGKELRPPHGRHLNTVADVAQRLQQKNGDRVIQRRRVVLREQRLFCR